MPRSFRKRHCGSQRMIRVRIFAAESIEAPPLVTVAGVKVRLGYCAGQKVLSATGPGRKTKQ
jgi:hypothetical protein